MASSDSLYVACAGGELVTVPAAGGEPTRAVVVEPDLRDVVIVGPNVYVSELRSAEILQIASDGSIANRFARPTSELEPGVAWRMIATPSGLAVSLQATSGFGYRLYVHLVGVGNAYQAGLGIIGVTMMSLYLFCLALLVGAELNQAVSDRRASTNRHDTQPRSEMSSATPYTATAATHRAPRIRIRACHPHHGANGAMTSARRARQSGPR